MPVVFRRCLTNIFGYDMSPLEGQLFLCFWGMLNRPINYFYRGISLFGNFCGAGLSGKNTFLAIGQAKKFYCSSVMLFGTNLLFFERHKVYNRFI